MKGKKASLNKPAAKVAGMLNNLQGSIASLDHAVLVGTDGLLTAAAHKTEEVYAEQLAAVASGLRSVAEGGAHALGVPHTRQLIVELTAGYLLVSPVEGGYDVAVLTSSHADLEKIGFELAVVSAALAEPLTPETATELRASLGAS